jgi:hypothetical protein
MGGQLAPSTKLLDDPPGHTQRFSTRVAQAGCIGCEAGKECDIPPPIVSTVQ